MHSIREMCCSSIVHQETLLFKVTISMHSKAFISSRYMICHVTLSYPGAKLHVMVSVMSPNSHEIIKHTASPIYSFSNGSRETVCSLVLQANKKNAAKELGAQSSHCMTFWRGLNTLPSLPILLLLRRSQIDTIGIDLYITRLPFTNMS